MFLGIYFSMLALTKEYLRCHGSSIEINHSMCFLKSGKCMLEKDEQIIFFIFLLHLSQVALFFWQCINFCAEKFKLCAFCHINYEIKKRNVAQFGRAPGSGSGSPGFESLHSDILTNERFNMEYKLDNYKEVDEMEDLLEEDEGASDGILNTSIISNYMREISKYPVLTREQEVDLFKRYSEGDQLAREILINSNLRLVVSIVKKYVRISTEMEMMDVIQEGNLGLMRAIEDFDYTLGNKFSTYAIWRIRQAALRGLHNKGHMIRMPVYYQEKQYQIYCAKNKLIEQLHREPTTEELAIETGNSIKIVKEIEQNMEFRIVESLDIPVDPEKDDGGTFGDFVVDKKQNIEEIYEQKELKELLDKCMDCLTEKESEVLKMRFGFYGNPMTLETVGHHFGVTRERIRQIEGRSIRKLRNYKTRILLDGYRPGQRN